MTEEQIKKEVREILEISTNIGDYGLLNDATGDILSLIKQAQYEYGLGKMRDKCICELCIDGEDCEACEDFGHQYSKNDPYLGYVENGFYETFKKELPDFYSDMVVSQVIGECLRAAKRAEMKVEKARREKQSQKEE